MDPSLYEQHFRLEDHHWWFVARRRLVLQELARHGGASAGPILDVGCGTGGMLPYLQRFDRAVGLDPAQEAAEACRTRAVPFVNGSATALPFADETFGTVTALDVIEHVPDHLGVLNEIYRVLRPGGLVLITVPAYQFLWSRHDELNHHQRRYRRSRLRSLVSSANFEITKLSYYNTILFPAAVVRKALMRFGRDDGPASHLDEVPDPLNSVFKWILIGERPLLQRWNLPFGASIICAARRPLGAAARVSRPLEAAAL
jgi:ubiquinone/menaquinone biosynthesis C-methylase UbiE